MMHSPFSGAFLNSSRLSGSRPPSEKLEQKLVVDVNALHPVQHLGTMEHADDSQLTDLDDEFPVTSTDGSATFVQAEGISKFDKTVPEGKCRTVHAVVDDEERYLQQRAMAPKKIWFNASTHSHTEQFLEVMKAYQHSIKDSKVKSLDLSGTHFWDQVMRLVKDTEVAYDEAGRSGLRQVGRFIGAQSESVVPYLKLIPNGFYTSTICGALKLVFELCSHIFWDMVVANIESRPLPISAGDAEHAVETFYPDPALYDLAEQLYLAILRAIEGAVEWLKQHPVGKQARALVRGHHHNKSFQEALQKLDEALAALRDRASALRDGAIVTSRKTSENVETIVNKVAVTGAVVNSRTRTTLHQVQSLQKDTRDMKFIAEHTDVQLSAVTEGIKTFTKTQDSINVKIDDVQVAQRTAHVKIDDLHGAQRLIHSQVETMSDVQQAKDQAAKAMEIAMETAEWRRKDGRDIRRLKKQLNRLEKVSRGLTPADLLDILDVSVEGPIEDFRRIYRACQSVKPSESKIAQGIIEGARFKEFVSSDDSSALFIEGGPSLAVNRRFASLSLMSCLAVECLDDKEPAISIHHFCRPHVSHKDAMQGPQGMMRSLISQVVRLFPNQMTLSFTASSRYREQLESHNLHILCACFASIIKQLPVDAVLFCVIDSIDCFENREWAEDCRFMMREVQDILYEYEDGPVFKLLVTSPFRSRYVSGTFTPQSRILVSGDGSMGRHNPTPREESMGARWSRAPRARQSDAFRSLIDIFPTGELSDGLSDSDISWDSSPER